MIKIAISGRANSGKNTLAKLITKEIRAVTNKHYYSCEYFAFANPIKAMIRLMYPNLPEKYLTGSSEYRSEFIPGAFKKNGSPLTVRDLLIELGNNVGRHYKNTVWLDAFDHSFNKIKEKKFLSDNWIAIVSDVRMLNEFNHLKNKDFYMIRLLRDNVMRLQSVTETEQDSISNNDFDILINNNGTLKDLKREADQVVKRLI